MSSGRLMIPRPRHIHALERGASAVADWLDAQNGPSEGAESDTDTPDEQDLWSISVLALRGASDTEVASAIRDARQAGWGWTPIALLLAESPHDARRRVR